MRFRLALAVFALTLLAAQTAGAQTPPLYYCDPLRGYYPTVPTCPAPWRTVNPLSTPTAQSSAPAGFAPLGDGLDDFCKTVTLPRTIVLCSDRELRALAIERQRAFDDSRARLSPEQQRALLADQKEWTSSSSQECGLAADTPPTLPVNPAIQKCMAHAGRQRITFLRAYGVPLSSQSGGIPSGSVQVGPSFDCKKATQPLARLICAHRGLARTDLRLNQAYFALRQQLDTDGKRDLQREDVAFINSVLRTCGIPEEGAIAGSAECAAAEYEQQRAHWLSRLRYSNSSLEEASRPIEQHVELQAQLQKLGFLPATAKIDGVYGTATRTAILAWQQANTRSETGFLSNADAATLGGTLQEVTQKELSDPERSATSQQQDKRSIGSPIDAQTKSADATQALREAGTPARITGDAPRIITDAPPIYDLAPSSSSSGSNGWVLLLVGLAVFYFLPTIIAAGKGRGAATFVANLFFGWTLVGWLIILIWALTPGSKPTTVIIRPDGRRIIQ